MDNLKKPVKIIDSHMHLWDLSLQKNSWLIGPVEEFFLGDYSNLQKNYLINDYHKDNQNFNIEKTVFVQAGWDRNDICGEANWINQINDGLIGAIVPYADLSANNAAENLAQLAQIPLVRGIRQIIAWHPDNYFCACEKNFLEDPCWLKQFKLLEQYQLSFDLQIYPLQTDLAYRLIQNHPNITFAIEHCLQPTAHDNDILQQWEKQIAKLANLPNAYMKISGMNLFNHNFEFETAKRLFETLVHYFSPERCMVGSNFPVEKLYVSFDQLFESFIVLAQQYTQEEQDALFYGTAKKFYRIT
jgi:predicted TIM-barrel fold metal-dependent hydrolase